MMRGHLRGGFAVLAVLVDATLRLGATDLTVPGGSFETPGTGYVSINIDSWQKNAKPAWYDESGGFLWTQLTGIFKNTSAGSPDSLDNCDGAQALWLFAVPEVALFQDYDSVDYNDPAPTHAFDAHFEVGKSYTLTVGINGGGGNMLEGVALELALYYRDGAGQMVTVAATPVVFTLDAFPNHTHLFDYTVRVPTVQPGDAWAGKRVGIRLRSLATEDNQGGYWDLDHVRLASSVDLPVVKLEPISGDVRVSWLGATGQQYQLEASDGIGGWQPLGGPRAGAGGVLSTLFSVAGHPRQFFRVAMSPAP